MDGILAKKLLGKLFFQMKKIALYCVVKISKLIHP